MESRYTHDSIVQNTFSEISSLMMRCGSSCAQFSTKYIWSCDYIKYILNLIKQKVFWYSCQVVTITWSVCEVRIQPLLIWCHPREALFPSKLVREVLHLPAQGVAAVREVPSQHKTKDMLQFLTQLRLAGPDHLRLSLHHLCHLGRL